MRLPIALLVAAVVTSFAAIAAADVASPELISCEGKPAGSPCTYVDDYSGRNMVGRCGTSTCGSALPDGGISSYSCPWCSDASVAAPDAGRDAGSDAGSDAGPSASAPASSGGCGMSRMGPLAGAFGIAMAVPLLVRRRRRS